MATQTKTNKYVVRADAVVVTVGKKANGRSSYTRVLRGGILNGNPESEQIQMLVRSGSIVQAKSKEHATELGHLKHRLTVKEAAQRMGAEDDPVEAPQENILPVAAGVPETDPDAILADDLGEDDGE